MSYQLRPLSLGEILDRTAELYRTHFPLFGGISTIFASVMLGIQLLYVRSLVLMGYPNLMANLRWGTAVAAVLEALAMLLLAGLSIVAINRAVSWVYLDQPASIRQAARSVLPRLRRYLWLMTTVAFRAWSPLAVLYVAYFVLLFTLMPHDLLTNPAAAQNAVHNNPTAFIEFGAGMLILAPLLLAATIYGVLMSLRYSLAVPACVVEDLPTGKAIKRSIELSKGSWGRIFVLGLLVGMIRLLLGMLFGFPIIILAVKHPGQPMAMHWLVLEQLGIFLSNALIGPIYAIGLTLFYYDQRIRKEGFDIEWMMQAAGLAPAATPGLAEPEQI
ncbi:MAG: hypothetical protein ABSD70_05410 [Terracidiphilus sp.]|jgi:hypothetical protein